MAKITLVGGLPNLISLKGGVPKNIVEAASDSVVDEAMRRMRPIVQEHYSNVIREIGRKLNGLGMPHNITSDGSRTLSVGRADGGIGSITTRDWNALSKRYAGRSPMSLWFWQKKGMNDAEESLSVAYKQKISGQGKVTLKEGGKASRNHHKGKINTIILISFSGLEGPFEKLITQPFAQADEQIPLGPRSQYSRKGLGRARYAEDLFIGRPFIQKMSAYLGKQMQKDLVGKLRKL